MSAAGTAGRENARMRISFALRIAAVATAAFITTACGTAGTARAPAADMIVVNAKIATLDARSNFASAMAVRDGRISAIGSDADVRATADARTRVVDARGGTVIPGLIDSHMHAVRAALSYSTEVNWIGAGTIAEAMARIRQAAQQSQPGGWLIVAGGWTEQQFAEKRRPTRDELVAAAPDNPVWVQLFYSALMVTPKAADALKLTPQALPPRMAIERNATGEPTGWIKADIVSLSALFDQLPKPGFADNVTGTRKFFSELNRLGVTGVVDPGGFSIAPAQYAALQRVWRDGQLTVRVAYSLFAQNVGTEFDEFRNLTQLLPMGFGDDMLKFNGIGERITAAMYNNNNPDDGAKAKFYEILRWAAQNRTTLTIHWQDNASVGHLLDLFERVNAEVPIGDLRWSIAHLNDGSPGSFARMKALGVGWTMQDAMYFQGDAEIATRGLAAASRMPPIMTAQRAGVNVGAGTDAHRVASYNPFVALQWLVDGRTVSGRSQRVAGETPSREQALRLYTQGSAWFSFDEMKRGTLEAGKLADFVLLNQDYFSVPAERIGRTEALLTVVGGRVVYSAPAAPVR